MAAMSRLPPMLSPNNIEVDGMPGVDGLEGALWSQGDASDSRASPREERDRMVSGALQWRWQQEREELQQQSEEGWQGRNKRQERQRRQASGLSSRETMGGEGGGQRHRSPKLPDYPEPEIDLATVGMVLGVLLLGMGTWYGWRWKRRREKKRRLVGSVNASRQARPAAQKDGRARKLIKSKSVPRRVAKAARQPAVKPSPPLPKGGPVKSRKSHIGRVTSAPSSIASKAKSMAEHPSAQVAKVPAAGRVSEARPEEQALADSASPNERAAHSDEEERAPSSSASDSGASVTGSDQTISDYCHSHSGSITSVLEVNSAGKCDPLAGSPPVAVFGNGPPKPRQRNAGKQKVEGTPGALASKGAPTSYARSAAKPKSRSASLELPAGNRLLPRSAVSVDAQGASTSKIMYVEPEEGPQPWQLKESTNKYARSKARRGEQAKGSAEPAATDALAEGTARAGEGKPQRASHLSPTAAPFEPLSMQVKQLLVAAPHQLVAPHAMQQHIHHQHVDQGRQQQQRQDRTGATPTRIGPMVLAKFRRGQGVPGTPVDAPPHVHAMAKGINLVPGLVPSTFLEDLAKECAFLVERGRKGMLQNDSFAPLRAMSLRASTSRCRVVLGASHCRSNSGRKKLHLEPFTPLMRTLATSLRKGGHLHTDPTVVSVQAYCKGDVLTPQWLVADAEDAMAVRDEVVGSMAIVNVCSSHSLMIGGAEDLVRLPMPSNDALADWTAPLHVRMSPGAVLVAPMGSAALDTAHCCVTEVEQHCFTVALFSPAKLPSE